MFTPEQDAAIKTEIEKPEYVGLADSVICERLCEEPGIPNPTPQKNVPAPLAAGDLDAFLLAVSDTTLVKLVGSASLMTYFFDVVRDADKKGAARLLKAARKAKLIAQAEVDAIQAYIGRKIPDRDWQTTIRDKSILEKIAQLRAISPANLEAIRNGE